MSLPLRIAVRYLFSRKKHNAVNIISWVSLAAVAVATAATVIVLSVFNGFSSLAYRQISFFAPPLMAVPESGRYITSADSLLRVLGSEGISAIPAVETQCVAVNSGTQTPLRLIGVPDRFIRLAALDSVIIDGSAGLDTIPTNLAVASVGAAISLSTRPSDFRFTALYTPRREGKITNGPGAFRTDSVVVSGVYQVNQDEFDADILLVPISVAHRLTDTDSTFATALYIYCNPSEQERIRGLAGPGITVKNRIEQQISNFRMISVEKWITFAMLFFILIIASFNIISTLAILRIDKEPNMNILRAMGASPPAINRIFMIQGWLITVTGGVAGIIIGLTLSLIQQHCGIIKLNAGDPSALLIDTYPVVVRPLDILAVLAAIVIIALLTSLTARRKRM